MQVRYIEPGSAALYPGLAGGGGDRSANERVGDARRKVRIKPLREINMSVAQA